MSNPRDTAARAAAAPAGPWAICLGKADLAGVGRLWQVAGIEVCELADRVWLRGPALEENLGRQLAAVPGARRFHLLPDGLLQPVAGRVPKGRAPTGPWLPLREWMVLRLPTAGLAGRSERRVPLVLVRSGRPEPALLLLTTLDGWAAYAVEAPQVRLDRLRFAVARDGRAVVCGQPLPPLPGQRCVERDGIAVPAGWHWSPPVEAAVVRAAFGLQPGDLALWQTDGTWQRIRAADFLPASRAAVRASLEGSRHASG